MNNISPLATKTAYSMRLLLIDAVYLKDNANYQYPCVSPAARFLLFLRDKILITW